jgi:hypothetical protein
LEEEAEDLLFEVGTCKGEFRLSSGAGGNIPATSGNKLLFTNCPRGVVRGDVKEF